MTVLWSYFWPCLTGGLLAGSISGLFGFRRKQRLPLIAGALVAIAAAALWHGPIGAADRLASHVERDAKATLDFYEMRGVTAQLRRGPLTRRLILSGPATDFQRTELVRTMNTLPGVGGAQWAARPAGTPLIVEAFGAALLGFLSGLLLAYLVELRRRYNAQWNW